MEGQIKEKLLRGKEENGVEEQVKLKDKVWAESKKMWVVAAPAMFTRVSTFGMSLVSQAFSGHIGSSELTAYSLVFAVILRFRNGVLLSTSNTLILDLAFTEFVLV